VLPTEVGVPVPVDPVGDGSGGSGDRCTACGGAGGAGALPGWAASTIAGEGAGDPDGCGIREAGYGSVLYSAPLRV
jgi:hypothetical protein